MQQPQQCCQQHAPLIAASFCFVQQRSNNAVTNKPFTTMRCDGLQVSDAIFRFIHQATMQLATIHLDWRSVMPCRLRSQRMPWWGRARQPSCALFIFCQTCFVCDNTFVCVVVVILRCLLALFPLQLQLCLCWCLLLVLLVLRAMPYSVVLPRFQYV